MKHFLLISFSLFSYSIHSQSIVDEYIQRWKSFYPADALNMGFHEQVFQFGDLSNANINKWLKYNRFVLQSIENEEPPEILSQIVNQRLLRSQLLSEIHQWEKQKPHQSSLDFYNQIFNQISRRPDRADFLIQEEINILQLQGFQAITQHSQHLISNLKFIMDSDPERSIGQLQSFIEKLKEQRSHYKLEISLSGYHQNLKSKIDKAINNLTKALSHVNDIPQMVNTPILGRNEFARRLAIYTDSDLTPEDLEKMSMTEIMETKKLMAEVSQSYLIATYPDKLLPKIEDEVIKLALDDMEKDVVTSAQEYLEFWEELADAATSFVDEKNIATLPEFPTLQIKTAPESAGAAARIGWVSSAPPFDPSPVTTLYLPSIPDTLSEQEQIEFWSSFNKPFNRMIVIHELIPGHYMQLKISRETPYPIRLMFPYGPYIEGWATFCEMIALDHGWEKERPLTYLAHLRKRLENANRAYTSVMVHCNKWTEKDVMKFSTETSLLAPQFAKSLWGRLMRSPMQITSYFYGGALIKELYAHETERLGKDFDLMHFMDTIMKAGPIPVDEFYQIFNPKHD